MSRYCEKFKRFIEEFPKNKIAVLYGPPGSGKTSCVYGVAKELDYEVIEFNASETRDKKFFDMLKTIVSSRGLFNDRILLLDESESIEDKNSLNDLENISSIPIVLTANRPMKIRANKVVYIRFFEPDLREIIKIAQDKGVTNFSALSRDYRSVKRAEDGGMGFVDKDLFQMCISGEYDLEYSDLFKLLFKSHQLDDIRRFLLIELIRVADSTKKINETFNALKLKFPLR